MLFVAPCVRRCVMPRRGWQQMDVPTGWVRVIRGAEATIGEVASCPPCFCRPLAFRAAVKALSFASREVAVADAIGEVKMLEAAIAALGADSVHARGLQEALRIARNKSRLLTVSERVESCKKFLERARQRVVWAQGRRRQGHRPESSSRGGGCRVGAQTRPVAGGSVKASWGSASTGVSSAGSDRCVDSGTRRKSCRDCRRAKQVDGHRAPCVEAIPPVPTDPQGIGGVVERPELRFAQCNRVREHRLVGQIGCLIDQGGA